MSETDSIFKGRVAAVDALRGIAAFSVCWYHFTRGNAAFPANLFLKESGLFGWMGVEVFFVISGFVIPLSLWDSEYRFADYPRFVARRVIRLDPPYLVTIALILLLNYLSSLAPGFQGSGRLIFDFRQVAAHLGYTNDLWGLPWLNPVFWSLALELQFYLLIGILFPFLTEPPIFRRFLLGAILILAAFLIPSTHLVFHWFFLFALGFVAFLRFKGSLSSPAFYGLLVPFSVGAAITQGLAVALICLASALTIVLVRLRHGKLIRWLGAISYSLYLLHVPIGRGVINLMTRLPASPARDIFGLGAALLASVAAAYLLYRTIERPAHRWAARVTYLPKHGRTPGRQIQPEVVTPEIAV